MSTSSLLQKLKLDSHHKMEQFSILFCIFSFLLALLFGISFKIHLDHQKVNLTAQAKYTETAQWSLTGQHVKVLDIYRNNDSSRIFILIQTGDSASEMQNMSINAEDYQILLTGYNDTLTNNPRAAYYVFGNTGYMGLYFVDSRGFDPHVYDIVVRNTNVLTTDTANTDVQAQYNDVSFAHFNQIRIYANFAGSNAKVADFLNKDQPTIQEIYAECVSSLREAPARQTLNADLVSINNNMNLANQYAEQLAFYGIRIPDLPAALDGDMITLDHSLTEANPIEFNPDMVNGRGDLIQSEYNTVASSEGQQFDCIPFVKARDVVAEYDADGSTVADVPEGEDENFGKMYLISDYVFPGGCQYNYQDIKLSDERLDELVPDDLSFRQFMESKAIEKQTYATINGRLNPDYYSVWYRTDGTVYDFNASYATDSDKAVSQAIENYVGTISDIYSAKYKYQTQDLYQLLMLDSSANTSDIMFSINQKDDVLIMY